MAVLALLWVLYRHVRGGEFSSFARRLSDSWPQRRSLLLLAVALMPLNWGLEVLKWRVLMQQEGRYPAFGAAFRAVMTGLALSIFTPARAGDYVGRSLQAGPFGKWRALRATFLGNVLQWLLMLALGLPAWCRLKNILPLHAASTQALWAFSWLLAAVLFVSLPRWYVHLSKLLFRRKGSHLPKGDILSTLFFGFRQMKERFAGMSLPSGRHLAKAFVWGSCRYLVYSLQLYLLLRFFGLDLGLMRALAGIWLIFLVQSGLPLPAFIGSTVLRADLAFWVWSSAAPAAVLAGMTGLFVLNLALPALLGAAFLVKIKENKKDHDPNKASLSSP